MSVKPKVRFGVNGGKTALMKGGPEGSNATMAFTCFGRESAKIQPKGPDWECDINITGYRSDVRSQTRSSIITYTDLVEELRTSIFYFYGLFSCRIQTGHHGCIKFVECGVPDGSIAFYLHTVSVLSKFKPHIPGHWV
jgi:hypothetical protein